MPGSTSSAPKSTILLAPADGEPVRWAQGDQMSIKASAEQTAGTLSIVEYVMPAGTPGPPAHVHPGTDEAWYVLEGELTICVDEGSATLPRGGFAFIPGDVPHTFSNEAAETLRFLLVCTPGGFEGFFREMSTLTAHGEPDFPAILALAASYGAQLAPAKEG
jgi:quercetin dioxygenase-like cupin family protein